jgi:hypothetical protein
VIEVVPLVEPIVTELDVPWMIGLDPPEKILRALWDPPPMVTVPVVVVARLFAEVFMLTDAPLPTRYPLKLTGVPETPIVIVPAPLVCKTGKLHEP